MTLESFFKENPSAALGFSGGADSSYLLYAALKYGSNVKAYYVKTAFQPEFELKDALKLAKALGADITVLEKDILSTPHVSSNPPDRCYHCKTDIFGAICAQARADGISLVIDGTNASDDIARRPGMRALRELSVRSPLRECGLTKSEIRALSKDAGLFTWDKPAYACLATRIPSGRAITTDVLNRVEKAENALFELGFKDFRVRVLDEAARLEFSEEQTDLAISERKQIIKAIKPHFAAVLLDLEGR